MSTKQKDDAVIAFAKTYIELHKDSIVGKLFLYADPNASNLDPAKPESFRLLRERCQNMNVQNMNVGYDYENTERPISSVSIAVRNRHVITQLLVLRSLVEMMRLVHHVKSAKGEEWPVSPSGEKLSTENYPAFKLPLLRSLLSSINKALVQELPTFIDDIYKAKYKNSGSFSYSLAETKFFCIKNDFLVAAFDWIGGLNVMQTNNNGFILEDPTVKVNRSTINWLEWYSYTYQEKTKTHKHAETYAKLVSAYCARIGKLKYENPPVVDPNLNPNLERDKAGFREQTIIHETFVSQLANAEELMNNLQFSRLFFFEKASDYKDYDDRGEFIKHEHVKGIPDAKKKQFQTKLYEFLMKKLSDAHHNAAINTETSIPTDNKITPSDNYKNHVRKHMSNPLGSLVRFATGVGIEESLVFIDMLKTYEVDFKYNFNREDFNTIKKYFTMTGICNKRVINSITKFISSDSQRTVKETQPRKMIPLAIELAIINNNALALSKIKITDITDPAIVFSRDALQALSEQGDLGISVAKRFYGLHDKTSPGIVTGYLQRGVMSLTSALEIECESEIPTGINQDQLRKLANEFDEMASLFQGLIEPMMADKKKQQAANTKMTNKYNKLLGATGSCVVVCGSPSYNSQPYIPGSISPGVQVVQGVFNNGYTPSQVPTTTYGPYVASAPEPTTHVPYGGNPTSMTQAQSQTHQGGNASRSSSPKKYNNPVGSSSPITSGPGLFDVTVSSENSLPENSLFGDSLFGNGSNSPTTSPGVRNTKM